MADAVETDATVQLRVEKMDLVEFTSHLANRQSFVATLSMGIPQYASKRHLLELAVNIERAASENVRTIAAITIQDGATGANMTEERKAAMLVKARQVLCQLSGFCCSLVLIFLFRTCLKRGNLSSSPILLRRSLLLWQDTPLAREAATT